MRVQTKVLPGGLLWRRAGWKPDDPAWASTREVEETRRALREYDPLLNLWWSPMRGAAKTPYLPGRWRVVRWRESIGNHTTVFYWEGPEGEYRGLDGAKTSMVDRLRQIDRPIEEVQRELDEHNDELQRSHDRDRTAFREDMKKHWEDFDARNHGVRQTFGPGYIRRREVKREDLVDTNHAKAVRQRTGPK